jgi:hypothetical protein
LLITRTPEISKRYYNDITHEEIVSGNTDNNGIDHWCKAGGIAGRSVLLDWVRWRELTRSEEELPSPITRYEIPYEELLEVAKFQGVEGFQTGDILLIRTGFVRWHDNASPEERKKGTQAQATYIGVKATPEAVEWIW